MEETRTAPQAPPGRGRARERKVRLWLSVVLVALFQVVGSTFAGHRQPERVGLDAFGYALLLAGPALLVLRRRHPVAVVAGTAGVALVYLVAGYPFGPVFAGVIVAFFTAVGRGRGRPARAALGLLYAAHLLVGHWLYRRLPDGGSGTGWAEEFGVAAWLAAVVAFAELVRMRREKSVRDRREREEERRRRADEERMRMARELHDVLAHSISVINVQAGVALALLDEQPEQARAALTVIRAAGKEALGEVRQVLDALRTPGGAAPRSPAPGLDRLPELAEQAARAGLAVRLDTRGERVPLPAGTELAAFRIVQEALTNVVRHSAARAAGVVVEYRADALELSVEDDGPGAPAAGDGGGRGLVGMRERAAALGGGVEAGPRGDGGFRVRARLPVEEEGERGAGRAADRAARRAEAAS